MSNGSFTEVTSENWFSRVGSSIKGIILGLILFMAGFPLLWWNEGRSIERYNSLKEGPGLVVSVLSDNVTSANNGKLIHTQGLVSTEEVLSDDVFGVSTTAIRLFRNVSMYQWQEDVKTETKEKVGGTKETRKTYTYRKDWSSREINSGSFKRPSEHSNPSMLYKNKTQQAKQVMLGSFKLNSSQISKIGGKTDLKPEDIRPPAMLANKEVTSTGDGLYLGSTPADPQVGDMKISFQVVNPTEITLIAQQQGNSFTQFQTKAGSPIDLLKPGLMDADAMFEAAQKENTILTWAIRIGGILMMWIGLKMVFNPLAVIGSVLPVLGDLISMGTSVLTFLLALPCAMLTIAFAWVAYRPLLASGLIAASVIAIVVIKFMPRKSLAQAKAQ